MVITGSSLASTRAAIELVRSDPQRFRCTAGVHPHHAAELDEPAAAANSRTLAAQPEVVAVGECGLDYFRNLSPRAAQLAAFRRQLELAVAAAQAGVPPSTRCARGIPGDPARVRLAPGRRRRALLHGRSRRGARLSRTRTCTSASRAGSATSAAACTCVKSCGTIPAERLLIETDAPVSAAARPAAASRTSRRNEPMYLPHVLRAIAAARGESPQELAALTTRNARTLFGWPAPAAEV